MAERAEGLAQAELARERAELERERAEAAREVVLERGALERERAVLDRERDELGRERDELGRERDELGRASLALEAGPAAAAAAGWAPPVGSPAVGRLEGAALEAASPEVWQRSPAAGPMSPLAEPAPGPPAAPAEADPSASAPRFTTHVGWVAPPGPRFSTYAVAPGTPPAPSPSKLSQASSPARSVRIHTAADALSLPPGTPGTPGSVPPSPFSPRTAPASPAATRALWAQQAELEAEGARIDEQLAASLAQSEGVAAGLGAQGQEVRRLHTEALFEFQTERDALIAARRAAEETAAGLEAHVAVAARAREAEARERAELVARHAELEEQYSQACSASLRSAGAEAEALLERRIVLDELRGGEAAVQRLGTELAAARAAAAGRAPKSPKSPKASPPLQSARAAGGPPAAQSALGRSALGPQSGRLRVAPPILSASAALTEEAAHRRMRQVAPVVVVADDAAPGSAATPRSPKPASPKPSSPKPASPKAPAEAALLSAPGPAASADAAATAPADAHRLEAAARPATAPAAEGSEGAAAPPRAVVPSRPATAAPFVPPGPRSPPVSGSGRFLAGAASGAATSGAADKAAASEIDDWLAESSGGAQQSSPGRGPVVVEEVEEIEDVVLAPAQVDDAYYLQKARELKAKREAAAAAARESAAARETEALSEGELSQGSNDRTEIEVMGDDDGGW